jgi:hypothetical protein
MDRNSVGLKRIALFLAAITYAGAVAYGDIMFLGMVQAAFPDGFLEAMAIFGAVTTAVSAIVLPLALHFWFAPGEQFWAGIIFWLVDVAALALNSILAYQLALEIPLDDLLATWYDLSPATPLLAVIGWGTIFLLDPSQKLRHAVAEIEANQIDAYKNHLTAANNSDDVYAILSEGARADAKRFSEQLTGRRMSGQMIDGVLRDLDRPAMPTKPSLAERIGSLFSGNGRSRTFAASTHAETDEGNPTPPPLGQK